MRGHPVLAALLFSASAIAEKEEVCVEAYVMDKACIKLGKLMDNEEVVSLSLEGPKVHTVHCSTDVLACYDSGYELLTSPAENESEHTRAYSVDPDSKKFLVSTIRSMVPKNEGEGACDKCVGDSKFDLVADKGFKATFLGTVGDKDSDENVGPEFTITKIAHPDTSCKDAMAKEEADFGKYFYVEEDFVPKNGTETDGSHALVPIAPVLAASVVAYML